MQHDYRFLAASTGLRLARPGIGYQANLHPSGCQAPGQVLSRFQSPAQPGFSGLPSQPTKFSAFLPFTLANHTRLMLGGLVILLLTLPQGTLWAQCAFFPSTYLPGVLSVVIAVEDVNGDGRPDLIGADFNSNTVGVALGVAEGGFDDVDVVSYPVGNGPWEVAAADVTGDGRVDIITANYSSDDVTVLAGLAGGGFGPPTNYPVGNDPKSVAAADVTGDGRIDIITANASSSNVTVLASLAGGGFSRVNYSVGFMPESVAVADVTGDGRIDIITANASINNVTVLAGLAGGGFSRVNYPVGVRPTSVVVADVTGDGLLDIITANIANENVMVLPKLAGGGFGSPVVYSVGGRPLSVAVGDVTGDGRLDIVTSNQGFLDQSGGISVLAGLAGGGYSLQVISSVPPSSQTILIRDVTGNGRPDIIIVTGFVTVLADQPPVTIATQPPSGSSVCAGTPVSALISVDAGGILGDGLSYQWYRDGQIVSGQNSATLTLPSTTTAQSGSYSVEIRGSCNAGVPVLLTSSAFNLLVNNPPIISISPSATAVTVGAAYSQAFTASGGTAPYSFSVISSNLPASLSLSSAGVLSGTPTQVGSYSLLVQAGDANGCVGVASTPFSLTVGAVVSSPIRYVRQGGTGTGNSWADASGDLQSQINLAGAQQVWVAQGTYKPTTTTDRNISFSMREGVAIYGGFAPSGTPLLAERNPASFTTVLSGDIGVVNNPTDNSSHVINNPPGLTGAAVLDGVVITGGYALVGSDISGGGMVNASNSSPSLINCQFLTNLAGNGGGMYNASNSNPSLLNCSFQNNQAGNGGGMYNVDNSSPSLVNCQFLANTGGNGGGMVNGNSSNPTLTNCSFLANRADVGNSGGMFNSNSRPTLTNCVVFGNGGARTFQAVNGASVTARFTLFEASVTDYTDGGNNLTTTTSPFVSATDPRLNSCSPAINAGDNTAYATANGGMPPSSAIDLAGNPRRFNNGVIDMGAYEYQGNPTILTLSNPSVSTATVGQLVSQPFTATGGTAPYSFSLVSANLPASLSLSSTGVLSGTPTEAGSYTLLVQAGDANGCVGVASTVFSLTVGAVVSSPIRYVRQGGTGTGNSWADASGDLQSQINFAGAQQVWVAQGTYKPTTTTNRDISFAMREGVAIYGGFAPSGTPTLAERNPVSYTTVLSGDIGVVNNPADNSYHVINNPVGLTNSAVLDGVVITGGYADNSTGVNSFGGGLLNRGSSPLVRNCIFQDNSAATGGGVYSQGGSPALINCSFVSNEGLVQGGGMAYDGNPLLTNCAFLNNSASFGAFGAGGGILTSGAGVLTNCSFMGNAAGYGGAMYNQYGSPTLINCSFVVNSANYGAVMSNNLTCNPTLINCSFANNTVTNAGGVVENASAYGITTLINCVLFGNGGAKTFRSGGAETLAVRFSLLEAGVTGYTPDPTNRITSVSPFVSASSVTLNGCAAAINAGSNEAYTTAGGPTTDLAGNARIFPIGGTIDMGAYEYQGAPTTLTVSNPAVSTATVGQIFSQAFTASGGVAPYSFSVVSSNLPASLSLSSAGVLSGTPTEAGSYTVLVQAGDANGCVGVASTVFSLTVGAGTPTLGVSLSVSSQQVLTNQSTTLTAVATGGLSPYSYVFNGPGTLSQSPTSNTATVSGLSAGVQTFTVTVTDASSQTVTGTVSITVSEPVADGPVCDTYTTRTTANGLGDDLLYGVYAVGNVVYAATQGGLSISTDGGSTFTNRTTANGLGSNAVVGVYAVGNVVYAACFGGGLSISTDGGQSFTNRTTANGLGTNDVRGVYVVGNVVYAATFNGLSISTDGGTNFTNKTTANGLGNNRVYGVYAVGSAVYAATNGGLSISTDGGQSFTNKTTANGLGNNYISGVYVVGKVVYAATSGGLSISTDGGQIFINRTTANGLGSDIVEGVYVLGNVVYAPTDGGLSISTDGGSTFTNRTTANGLDDTNVRGVFALGNRIYAATFGGGLSFCPALPASLALSSFTASPATLLTTVSTSLSAAVTGGTGPYSYVFSGPGTLSQSPTSNTATVSGLSAGVQTFSVVVSDASSQTVTGTVSVTVSEPVADAICDTYTTRTTANGLGSNAVFGVYAVGNVVYAATEGGLSISTDGGQSFTNRTTANGLGSNAVNGVYSSGGVIYAATFGGLSVSTDGGNSFINKTMVDGLGRNNVFNVYAVGNVIYAATEGGLSISTDGGQSFVNRTTANGLGSASVIDVYVVGNVVYAATSGGVSISTDGGQSFVNRTTANGLSSTGVSDIYVAGSVVYAVTNPGLNISTDGGQSFTTRTTANGLGSNFVIDVYAVGNIVYAATFGGLSVSTDGGQSFTNQTTANGLGSNNVYGVYILGSRVYAATSGGGLSFCPAPPAPLALSSLTASPTTLLTTASTSLSAVVTGGTGPYSYVFSGPGTLSQSPTSNTASVSGLSGGVQTFSVVVSDAASQTVTGTVSVTVSEPVIAAPFVLTPANGSLIADNTPTYSGTAVAGSLVTVFVDGNPLGTTTAEAEGNWRVTATTPLADSPHQVYATATANEVTSPTSNTNTFTIDTSAPSAPVVITPANGSVLADNSPTYTGTAEPNSTLTVFVDGSAIGTTTAVAGTSWSFTPTAPLSPGPHTVRARATDLAGNTSVDSNTNTFIINNVQPTVSLTSSASNPTSTSPIPVTITFSQSVTGLVVGEVSVTGGTAGNLAGSGPSYTVDITPTAPGPVSVSLAANVAQNEAGNGNAASALLSIEYTRLPDLMGFAAAVSSVCVGQPVTFTARVGNGSEPYGYTLTNGETSVSGTGSTSAFSQSLTASGSGSQSFTLTISQNGPLSSGITTLTVNERPQASLVSSGTLSCGQNSVTLTAGGGSSYTFSPGATPLEATNQALVTSAGSYSVIVANGTGCTATASVLVSQAPDQTLSFSQQPVSSASVTVGAAVTAGVVVDGPVLSYQWYKDNLNRPVSGQTSATLSLTNVQGSDAGSYFVVVSGNCNSLTSSAFSLSVSPPLVDGPFAITAVTTISCTPVLPNRYSVSFAPRYSGLTGQPISFSVVNELFPTLDGGPYTIRLYTDNPRITLSAVQQGTPGEALFVYDWLAACRASESSNTPPTVLMAVPPQSATVGVGYSYVIPEGTFSDAQTPASLALSAQGLPLGIGLSGYTLSGVPSTTVGSPYSVTLTATDPGGLSVSTVVGFSVSPATGPVGPTPPFAISGVTTISCTPIFDRININFRPQYVGVNGQAIAFGVVNELLPTNEPGPYSLTLYRDNPVITLRATQTGSTEPTSFAYHWLAACASQGKDNTPPVVVNPIGSQTAVVGVNFELNVLNTFVDQETPGQGGLRYAVSGLPAGLSLVNTSLRGVASLTGVSTVVLTATDGGGLSTTVSFGLTVQSAPVSGLALRVQANPTQVTVGGSTTLTAQVSGGTGPYSYSFSGPGSLSVVGNVAVFTSLPLGEQAFTVVVSDGGQPTPQQLSVGVSVTVAEPVSQTQPQTGPFSITGVQTLSCVGVGSGQRQVSFRPQYAGVTGEPISFSVVNELLPTADTGPYTLQLYPDNPTITLSAQQGSQVVSYAYHWLAGCQAPARLGSSTSAEASRGLRVVVLGNPIQGNQVSVEVRGAQGQALQLELTDPAGRPVSEQRVESAGRIETLTLSVGGQPAGILLLRVSSPSQTQTLKLLKR
ncbi:putative Ig domain-containing protein [Spirosoma soli]|uniref:Ig domain-containing protein n=1 Tax=Spirosoma soli TaxID=1770529 RepID=A0ABW5M4J7_9BACT